MNNNLTIEQIGALIETKGYAVAALDILGQDIARIEGFASLFAISRDANPETDEVLYSFPDGSCILIEGGWHARIG